MLACPRSLASCFISVRNQVVSWSVGWPRLVLLQHVFGRLGAACGPRGLVLAGLAGHVVFKSLGIHPRGQRSGG
eukprot:18927-Chlamydomonas_euryale.AAC.2